MARLNHESMREYLSLSVSSTNRNKINGMLAEIDLRNHLGNLGFGDRISQGGWIMRNVGEGVFGHKTVVVFPETIRPAVDYPAGRIFDEPHIALHTICSTMHQIGVHSFYCVPSIGTDNDCNTIEWHAKQLGIPNVPPYTPLYDTITGFSTRRQRYNFLRYHADANLIPQQSLADEFTKEHLRVTFQNRFYCEMSDIDGILWGQQHTYPLEIKEKTAAQDSKLGDFFGLDVGPFVKLAFYAAKKGNLHSLFFVKEIDNTTNRNLINWWFITFDKMALYASWIPLSGGTNMRGGGSTVVKIPKAEFMAVTAENLNNL